MFSSAGYPHIGTVNHRNGTMEYDKVLWYRTAKNRMDKRILGDCTMKTIVLLVRSWGVIV